MAWSSAVLIGSAVVGSPEKAKSAAAQSTARSRFKGRFLTNGHDGSQQKSMGAVRKFYFGMRGECCLQLPAKAGVEWHDSRTAGNSSTAANQQKVDKPICLVP